MSFDGHRLAINGDAMVRSETRPVVAPGYALSVVYLPKDVWTGLGKKGMPDNFQFIGSLNFGMPDDTAPPQPRASIYNNEQLAEIFDGMDRNKVFEIGVSAVGELATRSPLIVPRVEIRVGKLDNVQFMRFEDVIAEFLKRETNIDVDLVGRDIHGRGTTLIMRYQLTPV